MCKTDLKQREWFVFEVTAKEREIKKHIFMDNLQKK